MDIFTMGFTQKSAEVFFNKHRELTNYSQGYTKSNIIQQNPTKSNKKI